MDGLPGQSTILPARDVLGRTKAMIAAKLAARATLSHVAVVGSLVDLDVLLDLPARL